VQNPLLQTQLDTIKRELERRDTEMQRRDAEMQLVIESLRDQVAALQGAKTVRGGSAVAAPAVVPVTQPLLALAVSSGIFNEDDLEDVL
jgi:hypothetical protein